MLLILLFSRMRLLAGTQVIVSNFNFLNVTGQTIYKLDRIRWWPGVVMVTRVPSLPIISVILRVLFDRTYKFISIKTFQSFDSRQK